MGRWAGEKVGRWEGGKVSRGEKDERRTSNIEHRMKNKRNGGQRVGRWESGKVKERDDWMISAGWDVPKRESGQGREAQYRRSAGSVEDCFG